MATTTCPILRPTAEEFSDFQKYIYSHVELIEDYGIIKIIPPTDWFIREYNWRDWNISLKAPIKQLVSGRAGVYSLDLIELNEIPLVKYFEYTERVSLKNISDEERERQFWRLLGTPSGLEDPIYGADLPGTLFESSKSSWNVNSLHSLLTLLTENDYNNKLPGITNAMLYFGCWRAMFAFHVEDMNLYSINYLHFGESKSWYSIPERDSKRFENLCDSYYPNDKQNCPEYLRHKTKIISPLRLQKAGIRMHTAVQQTGEIIITFPHSYHAGYNHGFNIAESTNFATSKWIHHGYKARICLCSPSSVSINMEYLEALAYSQSTNNVLK